MLQRGGIVSKDDVIGLARGNYFTLGLAFFMQATRRDDLITTLWSRGQTMVDAFPLAAIFNECAQLGTVRPCTTQATARLNNEEVAWPVSECLGESTEG